MNDLQVAIYARVSSEQQSEAKTIDSQLSELRAHVNKHGFSLPREQEFIDDGYSGATLIRPALEQLRDVAAAGGIDRLYVLCPDRLARNYAHQVLLLEEFLRAGLEVSFLNRDVGQTPEDQLLLQVQGMISEYERAKIMERSRRGKRHAAQAGIVSVLSGAPYGYRYVGKHDGAGEARFEILLEEARVVRQVFAWVGHDRCSIGEVCRRLTAAKELTRTGKTVWDRGTICDMLKNPAYKGMAAFGKTSVEPLRPRLRAQRGRPMQPKRAVSSQDVPREQWMSIPVPILVSEDLFESVQEQLQENRQRARVGERGARYLLQGLLVCGCCGYAYYGKPISPSARKGHTRSYAYYRCIGSDAYRFGGERLCWNKQLRTDLVDEAVWQEVCRLLEDPTRLAQEYRQQLQTTDVAPALKGLQTSLGRLRQGIARLIDSYAEGIIDKAEFDPRIARMRGRTKQLEEQVQQIQDQAGLEQELQMIIGRVETFAAKVNDGLHTADWLTRREIIRTLVKRVEIDQEKVNVIFRISPNTPVDPSDTRTQSLQHCGERDYAPLRYSLICRIKSISLDISCFEPLFDHFLTRNWPNCLEQIVVRDVIESG
jgi:site-specific DNA recombinase